MKSVWIGFALCGGTALSAYATSPDPLDPADSETLVDFIPNVTGVIVDSSNPFDVLEHLIHARAYFADRDFQAAATAFRTVYLHDPQIFEARLGFAESLYGLGQVARSNEVLGVSDGSELPHRYSDRARRLQRLLESHLRPSVETAKALRSSIDTHPDDIRLYIRLAHYFDHVRDWSESQSVYAEALTIDPSHAPLRNNFGMSLLSQGYFNLAKAQFVKAGEIAPKNRLYDNNRRLMLLLEGEKDAAIAHLSASRQAGLLTDAALLLERFDRLEEAESFYEKAIQIDPSYNRVASKRLSERKAKGTT